MALELVAGESVLGDEHLRERGHQLPCDWRRDVAASTGTSRQPRTAKPFVGENLRDVVAHLRRRRVDRQERDAGRVRADRRELEVTTVAR